MRIFCFHASTVVLTRSGPVPISEVQCGDEVLSLDQSNGSLYFELVQRKAESRHDIMSCIVFGNGVKLKCTPDHPIWVEKKGWCAIDASEVQAKYGVVASNLVVGDKCLFQENGLILSVDVVGIELVKVEQVFYTISAGSAHCFFANGILVHDENVALLDLKGTGVRYEDLVPELL